MEVSKIAKRLLLVVLSFLILMSSLTDGAEARVYRRYRRYPAYRTSSSYRRARLRRAPRRRRHLRRVPRRRATHRRYYRRVR